MMGEQCRAVIKDRTFLIKRKRYRSGKTAFYAAYLDGVRVDVSLTEETLRERLEDYKPIRLKRPVRMRVRLR